MRKIPTRATLVLHFLGCDLGFFFDVSTCMTATSFGVNQSRIYLSPSWFPSCGHDKR
jgi:hypothetical protein